MRPVLYNASFCLTTPATPSQSRAISTATTLTCLRHYNLQRNLLFTDSSDIIRSGGVKTDGSKELQHQHARMHLILD